MNIEGLTEHQVELLDIMWSIKEYSDLEEWMSTLSRADRIEAENLQRLVVLEAFEDMLLVNKCPEAKAILTKFMLKSA